MDNIFVYLEIEDSGIADVSLELLTKGRSLANQLGCKLEAVAVGDHLETVEKQVFHMVLTFAHFSDKRLSPYTTLPHASILVKLLKKKAPDCFIGATVVGRDLAPRVSSALRSGLTADCTSLEIGDHVDVRTKKVYKNLLYQIRPAFGGNIVAWIVNPEHRPQMATVREGVMRKEFMILTIVEK